MRWARVINETAADRGDVFVYFKHEEAGKGPEFAKVLLARPRRHRPLGPACIQNRPATHLYGQPHPLPRGAHHGDFGPFAVAIAFWVFVAIATVAGIVGDYKKRQLSLEPLRAAIEKGQQLDPAVVERLMAPAHEKGIDPLALWVAGVIVISAGIGVGTARLLPGPHRPGGILAGAGRRCPGAVRRCGARDRRAHRAESTKGPPGPEV